MLQNIILCLVVSISLYTDLTEERILNKVVVPGALAGVIFNLYIMGWQGLVFSGKGLLVGLGLLIIPFILGGMGAGDVKLLGVIGAIKGMEFVCYAFLGTAIAGGIIALIILITKKKFLTVIRNFGAGLYIFFNSKDIGALTNLEEVSDKSSYFPYGLAIAIGTVMALLVR